MLISHERYAFLMYVLFGSEKNTYIASSKAAYRDLCWTLRLGATGGEQYRRHIDSILVSVKQGVTYDNDNSQATITPRVHENPQVVIHDEVEGLYEHEEYGSRVPAGALGGGHAGEG